MNNTKSEVKKCHICKKALIKGLNWNWSNLYCEKHWKDYIMMREMIHTKNRSEKETVKRKWNSKVKVCRFCKKEFPNLRDWKLFCSIECGKSCRKVYRIEYIKNYMKVTSHSEIYKNAHKKYVKNNPEKIHAHSLVQRAMLKGNLTRLSCQVCGHEKTQAHHWDYSKPLDVWWLCKQHHVLADRGKLTSNDFKH